MVMKMSNPNCNYIEQIYKTTRHLGSKTREDATITTNHCHSFPCIDFTAKCCFLSADMHKCLTVYSFPKRQTLDAPKLKEFADDNFIFDEKFSKW